MRGIENVSLVREKSRPAVYLIVGDVKFWIFSTAEFDALGFDWNKVRVVDDGALNSFTEQRLHTPPAIRPSDVFFDCGQDYDAIDGKYYWNCKPSSSILRKDVLVAGWLDESPYVNEGHGAGNGIEDIHYNLRLDALFLDRMYGSNGLSTALSNAVWPGNPPAPVPLPFATVPPKTPGGPKGADFNSWILPGNGYGLHCELNAWHINDKGALFSRHFKGQGPQPAFWANPLPQDSDAWFPFHPLDPEGTGRSLYKGDYIVLRGTIWQDTSHEDSSASASDPWNTGPTVNHNGWSEMHPPDWLMRVRSPQPNAQLTTARVCVASPGVTGPQLTADLSIWPDFNPSSTTRVLRVRSVQGLIDNRMTNGASLVTLQENRVADHVDVHIAVQPTGTQQARFKATWLVGWSEVDSLDQVWVDDQLPVGAIPQGDGEGWDWSADTVFLGQLAHRSALAPGMHQHYFLGATSPMTIVPHDILFAMVYLDPTSPPDEVMLQWHTTDWLSRAYWGENLINWGTDGTAQRRYMGPLPTTGEWVRLEVPAYLVGLGGTTIDGMAFTLSGGRVIWDYAGVEKAVGQMIVQVHPFPVSVGSHALTVSALDALTGAPVSGSVTFNGTVVASTNTPFNYTLSVKREFDPETKHWITEPNPPDGKVTAPGYATADIDFGV